MEAEATAANPEQGRWQGSQDARNSCECVYKGPTVTMPAVVRGHPRMTPQLLPSPVSITQPPEEACYTGSRATGGSSPTCPYRLQDTAESREGPSWCPTSTPK